MNYLDFVVEIGTSPDSFYPVYVISSPAGETRAFMEFPFNEQQLENQLQALQHALIRSNFSHRKIISPEEQTVQKFGHAMFEALFTGEVKNRYDVSQLAASHQGKGLRLKLRIKPPELASLPWEFLYDKRQDTYICLSNNTPIIRYLELSRPIQPLIMPLPLSILGIIANPKDLPELDIEREKQRIEKSLTWLPGRTCHDLQRAMRSGTWHIIHFIGHGGFNVEEDEGLISLENDEGYSDNLSATKLGHLLADHRFLRLVVLNSCDGARGSKYDIFSSTSAILVQRGIPAVLAMQYEITDTAAIELSRTFYEALAEGLPVDAAVAEARKAINIGIRNTLEWGTPVLYMRSPDGVLFDLQLKRHKNSTNSATIEPTRIAPPIEEQVSLWLVAKTAISNSQRTREAYETHISEFRKVLHEHGYDLDCEDENTISSLIQEWAAFSKGDKKDVSPHTFNQRLSTIRSFYRFALRQRWIMKNPIEMMERRKEPISSIEPLDPQIVQDGFRLIDRSTLLGKRDFALFCVLFTTERLVSEVTELQCGDIVKGESGVTLTFQRVKGGKRIHQHLTSGTASALLDYLDTAYGNEWPHDAPVWISDSRYNKGDAIGTQAVSGRCEIYFGTSKLEVIRRTAAEMRKRIGAKDIEKNLLQIN